MFLVHISSWTCVIENEVCRGYGGFGALGHSVYHRELLPRMVEGSWSRKISHIATSGTHTAAITESGGDVIESLKLAFELIQFKMSKA